MIVSCVKCNLTACVRLSVCLPIYMHLNTQAKTIEEIHAEAHAELGMMPATLIPALESLSALPRQAADEVELFPSFKQGRCIVSAARQMP